MVSLIQRAKFLQESGANSELSVILEFIFQDKGPENNRIEISTPQDAVCALISGLVERNPHSWNQCQDIFSKKNPDEESPWIYNSYLMYLFLVSFKVFGGDIIWLRNALGKRRSNDPNDKQITDFFLAVAAGGSFPIGDMAPLFLVYLNNSNESLSADQVQSSLQQLMKIDFADCKNEFLKIMYLKAYEVIIELKEIRDPDLVFRTKRFHEKYFSRRDKLSSVLLYIIFMLFITGVFFVLKYMFLVLDEGSRNLIVTLMGISGITLLEGFKLKRNVKKLLNKSIDLFFGANLLKLNAYNAD